MKHSQLKASIYLMGGVISLNTLSACQTSPTTSSPKSYTPEQSRNLLNSAIKHTLYSGQDFIAEQQIRLTDPIPKSTTAKDDPIQQKIDCQTTHDLTLISQMKADSISQYEKVANLSSSARQPYETIREQYQTCIAKADELEQLQKQLKDGEKKEKALLVKKGKTTHIENLANDEPQNDEAKDASYLDDIIDSTVTRQLSPTQIQNFNNFVAKSGKLNYTGSYRPFAGKLALQIETGFENKNLSYHYRLPAMIDIKSQALYIKPDIIMPMTALYMDNQLGMSWQDKWYKFTPPTDKQLPAKLVAKSWLMAIKDSFESLPSSQFDQTTLDSITQQLNLTIPNTSQPLVTTASLDNAPIIHWQQTANEQIAFYQAVIQRFIVRMDKELQTDSAFLALPANEKEAQLKKWQDHKKKLFDYSDALNKSTMQPSNSSYKIAKKPTMMGQDIYFVLLKDQIKHIYAQQSVSVLEQPVTVATWVTFTPDTRKLAENVQPATLAKLTGNIRDDKSVNSNVIDGISEFKRIESLDNSRRLFGQEPDILRTYKVYKGKAKDSNKNKEPDKNGQAASVEEMPLPEKQPF